MILVCDCLVHNPLNNLSTGLENIADMYTGNPEYKNGSWEE